MTEIDSEKLSDMISRKVLVHLEQMNLGIISRLEVLLPSKYEIDELSKWDADILNACLDSFVKQSKGRPDIDVVFIAEGTIQKECEDIIEQRIDHLNQTYPVKDITFKMSWSKRPEKINRIKGINEYKVFVEKKDDLEIEGLKIIHDDLYIVLGIHRDNIDDIPELAKTAAAKGCHEMSSRLVRFFEWKSKDLSRYFEMLQKLYEEYKRGNWHFYLFDQYLLDARFQGANWGCAAGKDKVCLLPSGIQVPCFHFLENEELANDYIMGDADNFVSNLSTRCVFSHQPLPSKECTSCEIGRFCHGGCFLDRNRDVEGLFGRNELFCELMQNQIRFLKGKDVICNPEVPQISYDC